MSDELSDLVEAQRRNPLAPVVPAEQVVSKYVWAAYACSGFVLLCGVNGLAFLYVLKDARDALWVLFMATVVSCVGLGCAVYALKDRKSGEMVNLYAIVAHTAFLAIIVIIYCGLFAGVFSP